VKDFGFDNSDAFTSGGKYEDDLRHQFPDKKFTSVKDYMKIKEDQIEQGVMGRMTS